MFRSIELVVAASHPSQLNVQSMTRLFTVGYGGIHPANFAPYLSAFGVRTVVGVRLRPDRATMGSYARAKTTDKGIQRLLATHDIDDVSLIELGNLFVDRADWRTPYQRLLECAGDLLIERVARVPRPFSGSCVSPTAHA